MTVQLAIVPRPAPVGAGADAFLAHVVDAYPRLTRAERKVADVLLEDPLEFARTSTAIIGDKARASAPSIMRFCRALGYAGLTTLKQALVFSLSRHDTARLFHLPPPAPDDAASAVLDAAAAMLERLRGMDLSALRQAVAVLAGAPQIACVAAYQLEVAALYARDCLARHGMAATLPAAGTWPMQAPDGQPAPAAGLFFCQGMPDAAMLEAIAVCQRDGAGAVLLSDVALAALVPASARLVLGAATSSTPLAYCVATDMLMAALLLRHRRGSS